ncbi:MAG: prepilin peptidase [Clostridiales bacterium]|nr:prepilin peptidase [Clostridiales bacterium]
MINLIRIIILAILLIPITIIDIKKKIIPNILVVIGALSGIILLFFDFNLTYIWGMIFGLGLFIAIILLSELIMKRQGMGEGDAKLMGVVGILLGLPNTILATLLAFFTGAIFSVIALVSKKVEAGMEIPFGPFIAIGAIISAIWGQAIIGWYLGMLL